MKVHAGTTIRPTDAPKVHWIAPTVDGTAHAYPRAGEGHAACGALRVDERFGYGVKVHCNDCLIVLGAEQVRRADPPITESEQRALWGDR